MANTQPLLKVLADAGCNYWATDIGEFYTHFRDLSQGALQKALTKHTNARNRLLYDAEDDEHYLGKANQHVFKRTLWDEKKGKMVTPPILLFPATKWEDPFWVAKKMEYLRAQKRIFDAWAQLSGIHLDEIGAVYEAMRQDSLAATRDKRKAHASEKVPCPHCSHPVARTHLARHLKTCQQP
jgi:hypothetical protein